MSKPKKMYLPHAERVVNELEDTEGALTNRNIANHVLQCTSAGAREIILELMRRDLINPTERNPTNAI